MARTSAKRGPSAARRAAPASAAATLALLGPKLRRAGSPARAVREKAYLKSDLEFYGTAMPEMRAIAGEYANAHPELTRADLRAFSLAAFETNIFELRCIALALADRRRALLEGRDLPWLLDLVAASKTWAHVDWIAGTLMGDIVDRHPETRRWLPIWAKQKSFWIRRTALLAQLTSLRRGGGDWPLFTRLAAPMLEEKEFFIRKAIGWVLREVSKKRPTLVYEFIRAHRDEMSGLTLREGAKYLSDAQRRTIGLPPWRDREGKRYGE